MSVRRLAEDNVQPAAFAFNKENAAWAKATIKKYPKGREQSAVIPLLMRAQEQDGWVTKAAIEAVADMLGMAYIRVLEVATFYTQFQLKPVGTRAHVQVCGTTPCMLRGAEELIEVCKKKIHHDPLHLNADGTLSWEEVECQGACVNAPMVMIFKDSYEDLTPRQLEYIIERFEAGRGADVKPGPQVDRVFSAPAGGPTTLLQDVKPVKAAKAASKPAKEEAPKTAAQPVARKEAAAKSVEKAAPAKAAAKLLKPSLDDKNRPAAVAKPEQADDLKLISGVGPKIEAILHELGIFTFAQVASWKKAEREWVDDYLSFSGRIERDDWQKQAKALAKGGEAEYIKVFGKKPR
jgi:NADH-quinone oxidoreductase subunit E